MGYPVGAKGPVGSKGPVGEKGPVCDAETIKMVNRMLESCKGDLPRQRHLSFGVIYLFISIISIIWLIGILIFS